jgi:lysophospholipase L1-like esterase
MKGTMKTRAPRGPLSGALLGAALLFATHAVVLAAQRPAPAAAATEQWVATWGAPQAMYLRPPARDATPDTARGMTTRMMVHTSIGGHRARIRLENAFGAAPVVVGAAHLALRREGSAIVPGSDRRLSFGGRPSVTLGPGMVVLSDPVDLDVPALSDLAVSLYLPDAPRRRTSSTGPHVSYVVRGGDSTGRADLPRARETSAYDWLAGVDVLAPATAVVAFGNSITDGYRSTPDTDRNWPARLAARLAADPATAHVAVVNEGISGNQVLRDASGVSALARLDRDALSQPGARWMIFLEGINDIGHFAQPDSGEALSADQLTWAYRQIVARAHARGIRVVGGTITPFEGAKYYSPRGEEIREAVNHWIRTSGVFDAVADFDAAVRDPGDPHRMRAGFDSGDHLHPSDAGHQAMADAVDVTLFRSVGTSRQAASAARY